MGIDLDPDELALAPPGTYTETAVLDICAPDGRFVERFDLIICRSTLEHVTDTGAAIQGLASFLAEGGYCLQSCPAAGRSSRRSICACPTL